MQEFDSLEHRDTASSNANKFNFAIDEENIDFNISGVPNAMVKRSHGSNVHNLIQQIENHPQRKALQSDLQQHRAFNPFSEELKDAIKAAGNTELCEIVDVEPKKEGCKEFHTAKQLRKRCRKKQYENIHDRFIRDMSLRKTMIELGRSEEVILEMHRLASEDHSHFATEVSW